MQNKKLLQQAHEFFTIGQYDKALFLYAQVASLSPANTEYQLYAIFCDVASENPTQGQALFDYFTVASNENIKEAIDEVMNMIAQYDSSSEQMSAILENTHKTLETLDAIEYKDFEKLIAKRGSFKIAFQDIMFSTKVAITSKDDFFDFVDQLIDNDFKTTAYDYLDGFNEYFKYDPKIMELYDKLGKNNIELNSK